MGRIQRPLNYKPWPQKAADWIHARFQAVRELGTMKQWVWEFLGCLLLFLAFLLIYCLVP